MPPLGPRGAGFWPKAYHLGLILFNLLRLSLSWLRHAAFRSAPAPDAPQRILVLAYTAVGDFIYLMPALRELRRAFPKARLTVAGSSYPSTAELLPAMGLADEVRILDAPYGHRQAPRQALRWIEEGRFDAVVASLPTSARFFGSSLYSIPLRIAHCRPIEAPHAGWSALRYALWRLSRALMCEEIERRLVFNAKVWVREDGEHMSARNLRLIQALGVKTPEAASCPADMPSSASARRFADAALPPAPGQKTVGLHIGSPQSQYAKIWAPEHWGQVCRRLGRDFKPRFVLVGGPDEAEVPARFEKALGGPFVNMVGRCGLVETLELIRRCDLFLGNDTGLSKAAMALGVPTAAVWGPSDRPGYGILWEPEKHLEIYHQLPCSPCIRMGLRNEGEGVINFTNCGHRRCLNEMSPDEVYEAIRGRYGGLLAGMAAVSPP